MGSNRRPLGFAAAALTGLAFLVGCEARVITKTETSELMQERGVVVDTLYSRAHTQSDLDVGVTTDFDGNIGLSFTPRTISVPETWGVVFRCDHGNKFAIQGSTPGYKMLWEKLDPGMQVTIDYKEIRRNTYEDTNGDGVRDLTSSTVVDYDFIDANPLPEKEN